MIAVPIYRDNRIRLTGLQRFLIDMKILFISIISICSFFIACKNKSENKIETTTSDSIQTVDRKTDSLLQVKRLTG